MLYEVITIEISGEWQNEIAPEYYANNECEIYLHKIDANDNRAVAGSYQGVFWMKTSLDASGFISDMLGDAPIDMSFDAGGEAVCDNLGISLNTTDDKACRITSYNVCYTKLLRPHRMNKIVFLLPRSDVLPCVFFLWSGSKVLIPCPEKVP